jgi:hypothetical protein
MSTTENTKKQADATRPVDAVGIDTVLLRSDNRLRRARGSNAPLAALIAVVLLLSGFMMWKWFRADDGELRVRARSHDPAADEVSRPEHAVQSVVGSPAPGDAKSAVASSNAGVGKNADAKVAEAEQAKPTPKTYKLQGIIYQPGRSSAVINGQTVFAGERIGDALVVSIGRDFAKIVTSGGQTNLLDLP